MMRHFRSVFTRSLAGRVLGRIVFREHIVFDFEERSFPRARAARQGPGRRDMRPRRWDRLRGALGASPRRSRSQF